GTDILDGRLFAGDEERKLNPMDFEDAFPEVMKRGGFDAIVGNPPYLYSAGQEYKAYYELHFRLSEYQTDFYVFFIERGIQILKTEGHMGMIVSDSWIKGKYFTKLREHLICQSQIESVTVFDYPPFKGATIENSIIVLQKAQPSEVFHVRMFKSPNELTDINLLRVEDCLTRGFIDIHQSDSHSEVIDRIESNSRPFIAFCKINRGVHAYRTDGYGKSKFSKGHQTNKDKEEQSYHSRKKLDSTYLPEVKGKHLARYSHICDGTYISYGNWLAESRTPEFFFNPKIVIRKIIAPKLVCTFIKENTILDQSVYVAIKEIKEPPDLLFLLGILASSVGGWYIQNKHGIYDTLYPWFTKEQLAQFPIPQIDFTKERDRSRHDEMVAKVEAMLEAKKQLTRLKTDKDKTYYENKCASLDRQIDRLVYELYGLTEEEIKIVEG
ncbi:Eco57I restriction-modification methylase domain-containing protein, partial [bacterium]|nr:Eco57I restriction-modification methylase domain-containing protein [bacterium]